MKEIILYSDEFPVYIWEEYCRILGESPSCTSLRLKVSDHIANYNGDGKVD